MFDPIDLFSASDDEEALKEKQRTTQGQIITFLHVAEQGAAAADPGTKYSVSQQCCKPR